MFDVDWAEQDSDSGVNRLSLRLVIVDRHLMVGTGIQDIYKRILDRLTNATGGFDRIAIVDPEGLTWIDHLQGAVR